MGIKSHEFSAQLSHRPNTSHQADHAWIAHGLNFLLYSGSKNVCSPHLGYCFSVCKSLSNFKLNSQVL